MTARTATITKVRGFQVLDSRNNPTVACKITLSDGTTGMFKVPSGASTGQKEALELRDRVIDQWRGKSVFRAAKHIDDIFAPRLEGRIKVNETTQEQLDEMLKKVDGTKNLGRLGANAVLAVSGAYSVARAAKLGLPLYEYLTLETERTMDSTVYLPVPLLNVLNAGRHADSGFAIQETMIVPVGTHSFMEAMEMGTNVWYKIKEMLKQKGKPTGRGDEGGFVNPFKSLDATLEFLMRAIQSCGYRAGGQIAIAFDGALSEVFGKDLWDKERNPNDRTYHIGKKRMSSEEVVEMWARAVANYPVCSIEDGMAEHDKKGWQLLTQKLGKLTQLVLDDYICTNPDLVDQAIKDGIGNASLIKLNQIGTVSDTLRVMERTKSAMWRNVVSNRSGETEDAFIADLAILAHQIKSGSSGADRNAKYNRLLMLEQELGALAVYRGEHAFANLSGLLHGKF